MTHARMPRIVALILALLAALPCAAQDDAAGALTYSSVYRELHDIAEYLSERLYLIPLSDIKGLNGPRYAVAKERIEPTFAYFAGCAAFERKDYPLAKARLTLAARLARDRGRRPLARKARLWIAACDIALKSRGVTALNVRAKSPQDMLLLAYLLDRLNLEMDGRRKELYVTAKSKLADKSLPGPAKRRLGWLEYRIEGDVAAFLNAVSPDPDFRPMTGRPALKPAAGAPGGKDRKADISRITNMNLYDTALLRELSTVFAQRAYNASPSRSLTRARAAIRLGKAREVVGAADNALAGAHGADPGEVYKTYCWRILKAAAEEQLGKKTALRDLARRLTDPAFAAQRKRIFPAVAHYLAEALLEAGHNPLALEAAEAAVDHLGRYLAGLPAGRRFEFYERARPYYGALAFARLRCGHIRKSIEAYRLVTPFRTKPWWDLVRDRPFFCVRYSALLFRQNRFAYAREQVFNFKKYGLLPRFPYARQIHSVSSALEYLYTH